MKATVQILPVTFAIYTNSGDRRSDAGDVTCPESIDMRKVNGSDVEEMERKRDVVARFASRGKSDARSEERSRYDRKKEEDQYAVPREADDHNLPDYVLPHMRDGLSA